MNLTTREKRKDLDISKSNETYLLGVLATDYNTYDYPTLGETQEVVTKMRNRNYHDTDTIYYNDNTNILFYIKPVSEEPDYIKNVINPKCNSGDLYVGIDTHHRNTEIQPFTHKTYNFLSSEERKDEIFNELDGRLILFKPSIRYDQATNRVYKNIKIQQVLDDYREGTQYLSIPVVNSSIEEFENKLKRGDYIFLESYNNNMLAPEFIICNDYIYSNFQSWKKHDGNYKLWSCDKDQDQIRKSKITFNEEDYDNDVLDILNNLIFVTEDFLTDKIYGIADEGEFVFNGLLDDETLIQETIDFDKVRENINNNSKVLDENSLVDAEENKIDIDAIFKSTSTETKFLRKFKNYTIKHNLCYDMKDLINFHVSVKTNPLTILAGMSGTGKTQIARAYGETLGINKENGTLLFLPISPSYTGAR